MRRFAQIVSVVVLFVMVAPAARAADTYKVDPVHSSVYFKVGHANIGYVYGRFNQTGGQFALDEADPTKSSINIEVQAASVDTGQEKRDAHLKSPDFLNAKQYPTVTFKSTSVKRGANEKQLEVTGDFTLHGVTKSITVPVELVGKGEFPPKTPRAGIEAVFTIKRTDFDMKGMVGMVGDEIRLMVAFEGTR